MTRKRLMFLWMAILLLAAGVALMLYGEEPAPVTPEVTVNFPRRLNQEERVRMEKRRVLPAAPQPKDDGPRAPERPRDPVLAALGSGKSAVVVEANAIRNSPVGKLLLECILDDAKENPIEQLKREAGVDILQDLDRVALTDEGVVVSGHFANARWDDLFKQHATSGKYGDGATVYHPNAVEMELPDGGHVTRQPSESLATWGGQMLLVGDNEEALRAMVDRVEGRSIVEQPLLTESQTFGEIYGVISADDLAKIFPSDQADLAERFRSVAQRIEVHVDTSSDVGIVADVQGVDTSQVEDLGKSLGAALSVARLGAQQQEEKDLSELLDLAKVKPDGDRFKVEMAIPLEMLEKQLSKCGERRREREQRRRQKLQQQGQATTAPGR
ncbi:MAG TPA: hypothetical protein VFA20_10295 [Myxococcaceae bacterium]|nr:hypothetical protein [Myxococcaceae bacterium]